MYIRGYVEVIKMPALEKPWAPPEWKCRYFNMWICTCIYIANAGMAAAPQISHKDRCLHTHTDV